MILVVLYGTAVKESDKAAVVLQKMVTECQRCGGEMAVINSRHRDGQIKRRRSCRTCNHRISTVEIEIRQRGIQPQYAVIVDEVKYREMMRKIREFELWTQQAN